MKNSKPILKVNHNKILLSKKSLATNIVESIAERVMQNLDQFQFETSSLKFLRMKLKGSLDIYKNAKRELVKGNKLEEPQVFNLT